MLEIDPDYGPEWIIISNKVKYANNCRCQSCKKKYHPSDLDVHHITPISWFKESGYTRDGELHYCYGVKTNKPWHYDDNLIPLCMKCHAYKFHPHMITEYAMLGYSRVNPKNLNNKSVRSKSCSLWGTLNSILGHMSLLNIHPNYTEDRIHGHVVKL